MSGCAGGIADAQDMSDSNDKSIWTPEAERALTAARRLLLSRRTSEGIWRGELSSSALATAVAVFALARVDAQRHRPLIDRGLNWLAARANADGGWGDTPRSRSNLSTTALVWAALSPSGSGGNGGSPARRRAEQRAAEWLSDAAGGLEPRVIAGAVSARYGNDRTFSAPILTLCALAGRLGSGREAWRDVAALPFELAACPHQMLRWLRLPVVSYALPALVAIGQVRHHFSPPRNPAARLVRNVLRRRTLAILGGMQPTSGGFLEAVPLTAFVVMSLAAAGRRDHEVVRAGVRFLLDTAREDGSWPIDTDLAVWLTGLAVNALAASEPSPVVNRDPTSVSAGLAAPEAAQIRQWLLTQQCAQRHPFTHAAPGGWPWTDRPGGVPDADDTSGTLLAIRHLGPADPGALNSVSAGVAWLLDLQNPDGGMPTFCRGWGALPFDRSCADITAHAASAMGTWKDQLDPLLRRRAEDAIAAAAGYLRRTQREDGSWAALWFGNEAGPGSENPVYGTARVVAALETIGDLAPETRAISQKGLHYLLGAQNPDGGWGGTAALRSSIEETAVAVRALAVSRPPSRALGRGVAWLAEHTREGTDFPASPIGFYFASLWYFEQLYPVVFTVDALGRVQNAAGRGLA
jgi:squalene-hopene/tetraprenyl-beta-curcumene cyclase